MRLAEFITLIGRDLVYGISQADLTDPDHGSLQVTNVEIDLPLNFAIMGRIKQICFNRRSEKPNDTSNFNSLKSFQNTKVMQIKAVVPIINLIELGRELPGNASMPLRLHFQLSTKRQDL